MAIRKGELPLDDDRCRQKLDELLRFYSEAYCCGVAAYSFMGTHYHVVARFEKPRRLSREDLYQRALKFYPRSERILKNWSPQRWKRFEKRIFDVSEFMRNIQAAFARWYNHRFSRKGRFWADRFKSTLLLNGQAVLDAMLYVDLNGVRAGLVEKPERFKACSAYLRELRKDRWMIPLGQVMDRGLGGYYSEYKALLYYRGAIRTKSNQATIPEQVLVREQARGFKESGAYLNKLRYFSDGLALGAAELVRRQIGRLIESGHLIRPQEPVEQEEGCQYSARKLRETFNHL